MQDPAPPPTAAWKPWVAVLAAGSVCLAGLLLLVALSKDEGGDMPPTFVFSAAGLIVAAVSVVAISVATRLRRVPARAGFALGAGFACIAVAKFTLAPLGLYQVNDTRTIDALFDQESLVFVSAIVVLLLYAVVLRLIYRVFRRRNPADSPSRTSSIGFLLLGVAAVGAVPIGVAVLSSGPGLYLEFVFSSAAAGGVALSLIFATALVSYAFGSSSDRTSAVARASALASVLWVAMAFIVLFHVLWVVYMPALIGAWPLKTVTPK